MRRLEVGIIPTSAARPTRSTRVTPGITLVGLAHRTNRTNARALSAGPAGTNAGMLAANGANIAAREAGGAWLTIATRTGWAPKGTHSSSFQRC